MSKREIKGYKDRLISVLGVERPFLYIFYREREGEVFRRIRIYGNEALVMSLSLDLSDFDKDTILVSDLEKKLHEWLLNNAKRTYRIIFDTKIPPYSNFNELYELLKKGNGSISYEKEISVDRAKRKRENSENFIKWD